MNFTKDELINTRKETFYPFSGFENMLIDDWLEMAKQLHLIYVIGLDYEGNRTAKELKKLIDDLMNITQNDIEEK